VDLVEAAGSDEMLWIDMPDWVAAAMGKNFAENMVIELEAGILFVLVLCHS
jgi:hypothetical protein